MRAPISKLYRTLASVIGKTVGIAVLTLVVDGTALAINASPHIFEELQPDGTPVRMLIRGDEYFHWLEDIDGYTVIRDETSREFQYALRDPDGRLAPTGFLVGRDDPGSAGLRRHVRPSQERVRERDFRNRTSPLARSGNRGAPGPAESEESGGGEGAPEAVPPSGTVKNLVVLMRFSDHVSRTQPPSGDFNTLFNTVGGHPTLAPTGSLKDVYSENSYGQMTLQSTISGWFTLPNTEVYYANGDSGLTTRTWEAITSALNMADGSVDFGDFDEDNDGWVDSIAFLHSGYGAEWGGTDAFGTASVDRMWSHRWSIPTWTSSDTNGNGISVKVSSYHISPGIWGTSGSGIGHIGVIAHETGHFFGLPDLYDTSSGGGNGIGSYGLMANSWGFDGSQLYPPHFSPWSKIILGWLTSTPLTTPGTYNVNQAETSAQAYRIDQDYPSLEYILVENRQPVGFDGDMPQGGLAIWHIDDSTGHNNPGYPGQAGWPENGDHYRVALLQADGLYELERNIDRGDGGDTYHGGNPDRDELSPTTLPNNDSYKNGTIVPVDWQIYDISTSSSTM